MKESVKQLITELFDSKYTPELTNEKWEAVKSQPNIIIFYKLEDSKPVAMVTLYIINLFSRKLAVIEEVVTLEKYRNNGIGSALVKSAINEAKKEGCDCVELTCRDDKPEVKRFYEQLGFIDRHNTAMRLWITKQ